MKRNSALIITVLAFALPACLSDSGPPRGTTSQAENIPPDDPICINDPTNPCCNPSPVILDLAGDGIHLTSLDDGVIFALGRAPMRVAWTEPKSDDAWLALDRNGNGTIDSGAELFGTSTIQPITTQTANGFAALGLLDSNGDGVISARDPIFTQLLLWQDIDHDGISQPEELSSLASHGIEAIGVGASPSDTHVDEHGNMLMFNAPVFSRDGSTVGALAWDAWLRTDTNRLRPIKAGADGQQIDPDICTPPPKRFHCYGVCYARLEFNRETFGIVRDYEQCGGNGYSVTDDGLFFYPAPDAFAWGTYYQLGPARPTLGSAQTAAVQYCVLEMDRYWHISSTHNAGLPPNCEQCDRYGLWKSRNGYPYARYESCRPVP